jgi:S1-C subfamily serine protease
VNQDATVYLHVPYSDHDTGAPLHSDGTGFIVSSKGFVLTANHVVEPVADVGNRTITGKIGSRNAPEEFTLTVIDQDRKKDVALLKINVAGKNFPTVMIGNTNCGFRKF